MSAPGSGAKSLFMLGLCQQISGLQVGAPYAPKATFTSTTSRVGSGLNDATWGGAYTGTAETSFTVEITTAAAPDKFRWRKGTGTWTTNVLITGSAQTLSDGVTVTFGATTGHTLANSWTKTLTATDGNCGLRQVLVDPGTNHERNETQVTPNELTGTLGAPQAIAIRAGFPSNPGGSLRTGMLIPIAASFFGKPVVTQDGANLAWKYEFPLSDASADAVSLWGMEHKGGDTTPLAFWGKRFGDLELASTGAAEVSVKAKGEGCGDTECGWGVPAAGNTGTYACIPLLTGNRSDANRYTDNLIIEITSAPLAGVLKWKVALGAGALSTLETSATYDAVSKRFTDWTELLGDTGALGQDECAKVEPLRVFFSGDVTGLLVGDRFVFPALCQIPGNATGETGVARTMLTGPRFGPAHISLAKGETTANLAFNVETWTLKLARTLAPYYLGAGRTAFTPADIDVTGYIATTLQFSRRFDSREYERTARLDDRFVVLLGVEGCLISGSTWKEAVWVPIGQMRVSDVKSPLPGPGIVKETTTLTGEQPASGAAPVGMTIYSRTFWDFSKV